MTAKEKELAELIVEHAERCEKAGLVRKEGGQDSLPRNKRVCGASAPSPADSAEHDDLLPSRR